MEWDLKGSLKARELKLTIMFYLQNIVYVERFEMLCGSALQFGKCSCYISEWEQNSLGGDIV